jgi:hypothetical protein
MTTPKLKAPFPWFGGKSRVAEVVWRAFGNCPNYVEPFAGSLAVMLGRPHEPKIETVNDKDCYLSNFWRAIQSDPESVAKACDWPVNEADLHARHRWLVEQKDFREKMLTDPHFFDAKVAGWWVWGISQWIGGGWCHVKGDRARSVRARARPDLDGDGQGVHKKMPNTYARGQGNGVHTGSPPTRKIPNLSSHAARATESETVHEGSPSNWRKRPVLGHGGRGVISPTSETPPAATSPRRPRSKSAGVTADAMMASRLPAIGSEKGVHGSSKPPCLDWFLELQARLRRVRVVCGDWQRVLGDSVLGTTKSRNSGMNPCGLFFDPPYSEGERDPDLYAEDSGSIAAEVRAWCLQHDADPDLRIALCGYEGEHEMPASWTKYAWKAHRGYAGEDNGNVHRERIWFSPHCLPIDAPQLDLFKAS